MPKVKTHTGTVTKDDKLKRIIAQMSVKDRVADVGLVEGKSGPGQIARYGFFNEYGTRTIHERPFMRSAFFLNRRDYQRILDKGIDQIHLGMTTVKRVLKLLGVRGEGDIKRAINDIKSPPNKEATIKRKKSSNPLIDDGIMRNAVTHEIRDKQGNAT